MKSVNSTNGLLIGVLYADMCEYVARISPLKRRIRIGMQSAFFFLVGCLQRTNINIQYGLRLSEGIDTICPIESKDAPVIPPTGTQQIRVDVRFSPVRLFPLEMPMGGVCL